jgi:ABC-2 type transport system permease protein/sodium transport system permease protein
LSLKELRETLRDRRTIATLVLMPLLVYPILSLAFRQFLLSSFQHPSDLRWIIATASEEDWRRLMILVHRGNTLLEEQGSFSAARTSTQGGPILGAELGAADPPLDQIDFRITDDLEAALRKREIDLGVRLIQRADDPDAPRDARFTFQVVYRPNMPTSRQAADFVERRLRAVNDQFLRSRLIELGDTTRVPATWRLKPVADEEGHSFWLGTLVPLVLILMTITGAVYPAIDLTAGERERGTLEALMAAPVPRVALLLAKYVAVVAVAMLTAIVNLTAMTVTVASSGLAPTFFGDQGLTVGSIVIVFLLLVLFAAFFSAVLLSITSFARSFKEAQAYLIPLMLLSLAPGFLSVMPGLELNSLLSVMPLANIVLLARDVLSGRADFLWGAVAVITTALYGGLALALAARVFGSDSMLYGSQGSWSDLVRRPRQPLSQPTIAGALTTLAIVVPLFIIASGVLGQLQGVTMTAQLMGAAGMTILVFLVLPLGLARLQGLAVQPGFQLLSASPIAFIAAALLGATLWPLAYNLIVLCHDVGLATINMEKLAEARPALKNLVERWQAIPPPAIWLALAIVPAICEELFFRGYMLGALRGRVPAWLAIGLTAAIFGLFHASVFGLIAIERVLSSSLLGAALGWVCWTTRSVLPGIVLHAINNGLMLSVVLWSSELQRWGWDQQNGRYLPLPLVIVTSLVAAAAILLLKRAGQSKSAHAVAPSVDAEGTLPDRPIAPLP